MAPRLKLLYMLVGSLLFLCVLLLLVKHEMKHDKRYNNDPHRQNGTQILAHHVRLQQQKVKSDQMQYHNKSNGSLMTQLNHHVKHPLSHPKKWEQLWADPYSSVLTKEHMLIRRVGYIDDRFSEPFIVLIAMHNEKIAGKEIYFAKITYHDDGSKLTPKEQCLPLEYWIKNGWLDLKHILPEIYVGYILRTNGSLLNGQIPVQLTVTHDCNHGRESEVITIWDNKRAKRPVKYGVCLHKGLFRINDPQRLVDWIEIHKALGVESITVYLEDVPETIVSAVQPYVDEGLVDILDWKLNKVTRDYGQTGVVIECHYMNMYSVQYLGTYDLDEIIVSVKHKQWEEMFEEISKNDPKFDNYASFIFRGLPWHEGHENETIGNSTSLCSGVKLPFYFKRTIRDGRANDNPKSIIRPLLSTQVHIHEVRKCVQGKIDAARVDQNLATCHHYRVPERKRRNVRYDNVMHRFKDDVISSIRKRLCK